VGAQEVVVIVLVLLIVFGPARMGQMARDVGKFAYGARRSLEEFKSELSSADEDKRGDEQSGAGGRSEKTEESRPPNVGSGRWDRQHPPQAARQGNIYNTKQKPASPQVRRRNKRGKKTTRRHIAPGRPLTLHRIERIELKYTLIPSRSRLVDRRCTVALALLY